MICINYGIRTINFTKSDYIETVIYDNHRKSIVVLRIKDYTLPIVVYEGIRTNCEKVQTHVDEQIAKQQNNNDIIVEVEDAIRRHILV